MFALALSRSRLSFFFVFFIQGGEDVMYGADRNRFSLETKTRPSENSNSGMASTLTLADVAKRDEGDYRCIVTNPYGTARTTVRLIVQGTFLIYSYTRKVVK